MLVGLSALGLRPIPCQSLVRPGLNVPRVVQSLLPTFNPLSQCALYEFLSRKDHTVRFELHRRRQAYLVLAGAVSVVGGLPQKRCKFMTFLICKVYFPRKRSEDILLRTLLIMTSIHKAICSVNTACGCAGDIIPVDENQFP